MAYNNKNLYTRIIEIQTLVLYLREQDEDISYKEMYWQHIYPRWKICYRTYHTYLGTPAKRELKKLLSAEKEKIELENKSQYKLFK
ncbi:hypothetical protein LNI98_07020 [Tenacibaculum dicentrarchi]|uniref:Uncharacterized protein n=1 Tax=Tenacibaculum piscium TaxID=1458515 RepID=A0A2H1YHB2_9FLAO|nr:hypothetical protein [Tenacibaculum piscium]MCD8449443.1 hypothetical protein [Tenacibaculum dicentrarchi]MBE7630099.1 hypothetical protein [Tenacibaculum piscium]MBE7671618.1 hypothetical protein [Tenacibaculum piscium]MBE7686583.1 hypothetical protein [Tenacibaculum piscium]MBE7691229.1 hypothetical protein [Tenacibaculum piscium]